MTTSELDKFWSDISVAYNQVAANHEREVTIYSEAADLTATIGYDKMDDAVIINVFVGKWETGDKEN